MRRVALALLAGLLTSGPAMAGSQLSLADKASLQAAMQHHIDGQLVNGVFLRLNMKEGRVDPLAVTKAHPMILKMGEHFVLCSDFRGPDGKEVPVDFYMARAGAKFVIFHTEIANRAPLEKLVSEGKVAVLD